MTQSSKEELLQKWAPIIDSMGVTGSKADWMSQYVEMHSINENQISSTQSNFNLTLLPIAKRVFAKTVSLDLVDVNPIGGGNSSNEMKEIRSDIKIENRDRKIDSITEDKCFDEMKVEDHPKYKEQQMPKSNLFYLDYQYGGGTSSNTHKKTRRSKKKKKNEKV
jgi:hypothetical protein